MKYIQTDLRCMSFQTIQALQCRTKANTPDLPNTPVDKWLRSAGGSSWWLPGAAVASPADGRQARPVAGGRPVVGRAGRWLTGPAGGGHG